MYCNKCGNKINENDQFCSSCGISISGIPKDTDKRNKIFYIVGFIILILPPIISKILYYSDIDLLSESMARNMSMATKIGIVVLTIWYTSNLLKIWQAVLLGILTILPLMTWVSFIILILNNKKREIILGKNGKKLFIFLTVIITIGAAYYLFQTKVNNKQSETIANYKQDEIPKIVNIKGHYYPAVDQYEFEWTFEGGIDPKLADNSWGDFKDCNLNFTDNNTFFSVPIISGTHYQTLSDFYKDKYDSLNNSYCVKISCIYLDSQTTCFNKKN